MKRHGDRLVTKRGERFAIKRADWSRVSYIKQMCDIIYDVFLEARVACQRETPVFLDRSGNIVKEEFKYSEAVDLEITHPDYILFCDKT